METLSHVVVAVAVILKKIYTITQEKQSNFHQNEINPLQKIIRGKNYTFKIDGMLMIKKINIVNWRDIFSR